MFGHEKCKRISTSVKLPNLFLFLFYCFIFFHFEEPKLFNILHLSVSNFMLNELMDRKRIYEKLHATVLHWGNQWVLHSSITLKSCPEVKWQYEDMTPHQLWGNFVCPHFHKQIFQLRISWKSAKIGENDIVKLS